MPIAARAAKTALKRLVPGVTLRRAASSPRHRIAMRPRRAVASDIENGSAFMIVLLPRERADREQDLDGEPSLGRREPAKPRRSIHRLDAVFDQGSAP